jgi:hypothetical protein
MALNKESSRGMYSICILALAQFASIRIICMVPHFRLSSFASSDALQMITMILISRLRLVCRSTPWIDTFSPGLTRSALSRGASDRLHRYRNVTIHDSRFVLIKRWSNKAGMRKRNALQMLHLSLSLSLLHALHLYLLLIPYLMIEGWTRLKRTATAATTNMLSWGLALTSTR